MKNLNQKDLINQLSIDCVIFGYRQNKLQVLVPKMDFKGDFWALPSGFVQQQEGIDKAAQRILEERTGIGDIFLEQYRVFGDVPRTNRAALEQMIALNPDKFEQLQDGNFLEWLTQRFIAIGYYALVDINKVTPKLTEIDQSIDWYEITDLPQMVMDHEQHIHNALEALRLNLDSKLLGFNLLPEEFTMKDLQLLYEAVYDKPFRRNNFQKKMLDLNVLERMGKKLTGAANKAPYLYRFKR
ncbi:NrtR DNA-binding winged helix domain-containing protein [Maribacter sp. CXY002]|uniref:NrtR DNA-binding winged helix domain-containing protein n=1 Tax=Maribacter luteocoastalis TaxID=3407671 RepID=UPI003B677B21